MPTGSKTGMDQRPATVENLTMVLPESQCRAIRAKESDVFLITASWRIGASPHYLITFLGYTPSFSVSPVPPSLVVSMPRAV